MPYTYDGTEWTQTTTIPTSISWTGVDDKPSDFPPSSHQHSLADILGLAAALSGKAESAITVGAGPGLTGGGSLAANRTIGVNFGDAVGTVCQGNDSRLANQRTPLDNSVTNAKIPANANIDPAKLGTGRVTGSVNGVASNLTIWRGTQAQYDAISPKDSSTLYVVRG